MFCVNFLKKNGESYIYMCSLNMIIPRRKLMMVILYFDNVQQHMRALQRNFVKLHGA